MLPYQTQKFILKTILTFLPFGLLFFFGITEKLQATEKSINAFRTSEEVELDGRLDETDWKFADIATDFIQSDPYPGADANFHTEVSVLYDDNAIYIGARLYDSEPEKILRELSERNVIANADHFEVIIDPYRDGINGYSFAVTASGVQVDARMYSDRKDNAWDAVWESEVTIDSLGWVVEMRIPYSAIRFPGVAIQEWSINFGRNIRRTREQNWWREIDPRIDGVLQQSGRLNGIANIEPPLRLSLYPFLAVTKDYSDFSSENPWGVSGGLDLKYGISQAFTLDVTLIPDFSQALSDRDVLNLSPFEVVFDENRQFFTEGMEIFNRGDLFYSRRVGGRPGYFIPVGNNLEEGDVITEFPQTSNLLNATKLSGRNRKGTGIGVFNAISGREFATIQSADGAKRTEKSIPLTNYNVLVADQSLRNNSSIALMNTNVWREGSAPSANATGTDFRFFTQDRMYVVRGYGHYSITELGSDFDRISGHQYNLELAKVSGRFRASARYREISDTFDPNDLGLLLVNNERRVYLRAAYHEFEPMGPINRWNTSLQLRYSQLYSESIRTGLSLNWDNAVYLRTWDAFFFYLSHNLKPSRDFFEPRTGDFSRFYLISPGTYGRFHYSSDYRRTFAVNFRLEGTRYPESDRYIWGWMLGPRIRFSDRFFTIFTTNHVGWKGNEGFISPQSEAVGFESLQDGDIVFGRRARKTIENTLDLRYIFSNRMNVTFRARHFYSRVDYSDFFTLEENGKLTPSDYTGKTEDFNDRTLHDLKFHLFNIDMVYTWRFAPGSDLIFVWKNNIMNSSNEDYNSYMRELRNVWDSPQENSFVLKVVYYLDYHRMFQN